MNPSIVNSLGRCAQENSKSIAKIVAKPVKCIGAMLLIGMAVNASAVEPLSVSGNKVLAGGRVASFSGGSLFWSNTGWGGEKYYNAEAVAWLKSDWNAKLVRAAMGVDANGGYLSDANNKARVIRVADAALVNDMYVIIDWHSHHAENYKSQAIAFFEEMARKYGGSNNVIYEIYNEPLNNVSWSGTIKPYAIDVIRAIRAIDPDNLIVVGTPTWSQDVDVASRDPITGFANIAYTLHFYAGTHGQSLRDKAQTALSNGIALFVTEWGAVNADGNGGIATAETNAWIDFMKANHLSNANWAVNDKNEGASALVAGASPNGGWTASQLTPSGTLVRNMVRGWPSGGGGGGGVIKPPTTDVRLLLQHSDKCVDVADFSIANGGNIQQWSCGNGDNQKFRFRHRGSGWYNIVGKQSGKCLDVAGVSTADGANVQQWGCGTGQNQQFKLVNKGGGWFQLMARHSGKCVDVSGVSATNGANIQQWACQNGGNQLFEFNGYQAPKREKTSARE